MKKKSQFLRFTEQKVLETAELVINESIKLNLPKGLYFLSVEIEAQYKLFKIIKE
ncbi:MAG: T9SS type A sorting domain-containing protein [Bacteroidota bacterium]|nr:T9SS type A sorting domain-containing protein [Bacteroidota bacterium]